MEMDLDSPDLKTQEDINKNKISQEVKPSLLNESNTQLRVKPSFNCDKKLTNIENMICLNSDISELDLKMNELFQIEYTRQSNKKLLIQGQKKWIKKERDVCLNEECLINTYKNRNLELERMSK